MNEYNRRQQRAAAPRIKQILRARAKGMTLQAVGDLFHMSRERVHQIEKRAARAKRAPIDKPQT